MLPNFEELLDLEEELDQIPSSINEAIKYNSTFIHQEDVHNAKQSVSQLPHISSLTSYDTINTSRNNAISAVPLTGNAILEPENNIVEEKLTITKSTIVSISKVGKRKTLSHGKFIGNPRATSEREAFGPTCRFVFVPSGWRTESEGDYLPTLFTAMGIPFPSVTFVLEKSVDKTFPDLGARRVDSDGREHSIVEDNPTDGEVDLFLLLMQSRMAAIMEAISTASIQCDAIYFMKFPFLVNDFTEIALDNLANGGIALSTFPLDYKVDGVHAVFDAELIKDSVVNIEDEIETGIKWGPPLVNQAQILRKITHICIFESSSDHEHFQSLVEREIPQGILAAAGSNSVLESALLAMKQGRPLFIFKHTTRSGYLLSKLIDFYDSKDSHKYEQLHNALSDLKKKEIYDIPSSDEMSETMDRRVMKLAYNCPASFNRKAILVVDPLQETDPNRLLDNVSTLIASIYDSGIELGGTHAENRLFQQAILVDRQLRLLMRKELRIANVLKALIIIITFVTTTLACTLQYFRYESSEDEEQVISTFNVLTILLPICLGICVTVMAAFSPISKFAVLKLLHARLQQEMYKYRCRIGDYRVRSKLGAIHRIAFVNQLRKLWDELMNSDVIKGSIDTNTKILPELVGEDMEEDEDFIKNYSKDSSLPRFSWCSNCNSHDYRNRINRYKLEPLSSEEYLQERVETSLNRYAHLIPHLAWELKCIQLSIIIVSSAGTLLAAYELQLWMPILLALVAALHAYTEYAQTAITLKSMNVASTKLKQIIYWWTSLTLMQQRMPKMKQRLVLTVERVILDQIRLLIEQDLESKKDDNYRLANSGHRDSPHYDLAGHSISSKFESSDKKAHPFF